MGLRFEGLDEPEVELHELNILVVGCGGGGCNSIHRLNLLGIEAATTIAINTDQKSLKATECPNRLLLGVEYTKGLGTGGRPDIGEECALNAAPMLSKLFQGVDLTFIVTGLVVIGWFARLALTVAPRNGTVAEGRGRAATRR